MVTSPTQETPPSAQFSAPAQDGQSVDHHKESSPVSELEKEETTEAVDDGDDIKMEYHENGNNGDHEEQEIVDTKNTSNTQKDEDSETDSDDAGDGDENGAGDRAQDGDKGNVQQQTESASKSAVS